MTNSRIAAFFDIDGTLVALPSIERRFTRYLLRRHVIGARDAFRWLARFIAQLPFGWQEAAYSNKAHLAGVGASTASEWLETFPPDALPWFPGAIRRLVWHHAQGHRIVLVSGTLAPLARLVAKRLPVPVEVCATRLELIQSAASDAYWSGRIEGRVIRGDAKAQIVTRLAARERIEVAASFAYGDQLSDVPMLQCVGNAFAVNPSKQLEIHARRSGWTVLRWNALHEPASLSSKLPGRDCQADSEVGVCEK
jgi:HAD superfamily hydrolase (TIGR01490 family)